MVGSPAIFAKCRSFAHLGCTTKSFFFCGETGEILICDRLVTSSRSGVLSPLFTGTKPLGK